MFQTSNFFACSVPFSCFQEKREKLKKEGKLLTAAQKEQKRRAERMLEAMKQQGLNNFYYSFYLLAVSKNFLCFLSAKLG